MFSPESQSEVLDTTIRMMLDNDLAMELDVALSNTVTKSACLTKRCVCKEKSITCKDLCTCNTRKSKNQMEVVLISSFIISCCLFPDT